MYVTSLRRIANEYKIEETKIKEIQSTDTNSAAQAAATKVGNVEENLSRFDFQ
jgi:hypothetical protein